jgi:hypothetical protein
MAHEEQGRSSLKFSSVDELDEAIRQPPADLKRTAGGLYRPLFSPKSAAIHNGDSKRLAAIVQEIDFAQCTGVLDAESASDPVASVILLPCMDVMSNGEGLAIGAVFGTNTSSLRRRGEFCGRSSQPALATQPFGMECMMFDWIRAVYRGSPTATQLVARSPAITSLPIAGSTNCPKSGPRRRA